MSTVVLTQNNNLISLYTTVHNKPMLATNMSYAGHQHGLCWPSTWPMLATNMAYAGHQHGLFWPPTWPILATNMAYAGHQHGLCWPPTWPMLARNMAYAGHQHGICWQCWLRKSHGRHHGTVDHVIYGPLPNLFLNGCIQTAIRGENELRARPRCTSRTVTRSSATALRWCRGN
jgi:hypothetical protein